MFRRPGTTVLSSKIGRAGQPELGRAMLHPAHADQVLRLLANVAEGRRDLDERESRIPTSHYTSAARFEAERAVLFRRQPVILASPRQLAEPGACLTHDALGLPLLLVRDRAGELRAFLNVCRHRGTRLVDDQGVCHKKALLCPYHHWMYALDGQLIRMPLADEGFPGLDRAERGLVRLPLEVRHGLVWLVPDPKASIDLDAHLGGLGDELEALGLSTQRFYRQGSTRCQANWKLIIDAFSEAYHIRRLHQETLGGFFADCQAVMDRAGRHLRASVGRSAIEEARDLAEVERDPRDYVTFTYYLFPNSILVFSPDYVTHLGFFPQSADETIVVDTMLVPHDPVSEEEDRHWGRSFDLIDGQVFNQEDYRVAEQGQIGLCSGANDELIVGRLEKGVRIFHEILDEALAEAEG